MLWLFPVIEILTFHLAATCQTNWLVGNLCFSAQTSFSRSRKRTWTSSWPPSLNPSQTSPCRQRRAWRSPCPRANPTGRSRSPRWAPAQSQRVRVTNSILAVRRWEEKPLRMIWGIKWDTFSVNADVLRLHGFKLIRVSLVAEPAAARQAGCLRLWYWTAAESFSLMPNRKLNP